MSVCMECPFFCGKWCRDFFHGLRPVLVHLLKDHVGEIMGMDWLSFSPLKIHLKLWKETECWWFNAMWKLVLPQRQWVAGGHITFKQSIGPSGPGNPSPPQPLPRSKSPSGQKRSKVKITAWGLVLCLLEGLPLKQKTNMSLIFLKVGYCGR